MAEERDEAREKRIEMEIVVDAYDEEEQALGWYYYLENKLRFPFRARCIGERKKMSPLRVDETVEVVGMPTEDDCRHAMFVSIKWKGRTLGVPLSQLTGIDVDDDTKQAIEDWHYWIRSGYQL